MKNKIKQLFTILVVTAGCLMFASFSPSLDGRAVVVDEGVFPQGLFAKTVGYLPGDIISVTNIAGDTTIDLLVIGALDPSEGVAIMLSPEAAQAMGIDKGSNNIVKITKRSGQDERVYGNAVITKSSSEMEAWDDSDFENIGAEENTEAFDEAEEESLEEAAEEMEEAPVEESDEFAEPEEAPVEEDSFEEAEDEFAEEEAFETETEAEEFIEEELPVEEASTEEPVEEELPAEETEENTEEEFEAEDPEALDDESEAEEEAFAEEELSELPEEEEASTETSEEALEEGEAEPLEDTFAEESFDEESPAELPVEEENPVEEDIPEEGVFEEEAFNEEAFNEEAPAELPEEEEPEEDIPSEEAFVADELDELPAEKAIEEEAEIAEDTEVAEETEEYEAIVLVPADSNPPEDEKDEVVDLVEEDELEAIDEPVELKPLPATSKNAASVNITREAPLISKFETTTSYEKYIVPSLKELESGKYYIQIAVYSTDENILEVINKYGSNYPITIVPMAGGVRKQVLVGPVTMDEYAVVLERFKSYGFKDAFLRKVR